MPYVRRRRRRKKFPLVPVLTVAAICVILGLMYGPVEQIPPGPGVSTPRSAVPPSEMPVVGHKARVQRIVYPYSVIPGGAQDRDELTTEMNRDPVVAAHYAGFRATEARVIQLREEMLAHVSYRIADRVFWTAKKIRLAPGEPVITDGQQIARTRCGNKISVLPQDPVSPEEPPSESFEIPIGPEEVSIEAKFDEPEISDAFPPPREETPFFLPYLINPPTEFLPSRVFYVPPGPVLIVAQERNSAVPEPATLVLLGSGMAAILLLGRRHRRQQANDRSRV